ncbi:Beta-amyloid-like protein [Aphelenchoides besseyi]|nr:Beta-amyloid-like protein [Aphelenchoides besseyi]KAI6229402.1 Beta-amyloid-like protein [Aphelenchoides besseyi]
MSAGPPTICLLLALLGFGAMATQIKSISANVDQKPNHHHNFVPLVAFKCGYRNKFMNESGEWVDDASSAAVCLTGKLDILKYCKRVYPHSKISNIVEYGHISHIDNWCRENGRSCKHTFTIRPYRCIEGEDFIADSLQVPSKCKFGHVSGRNTCDDFDNWSEKAQSQCRQNLDAENKPMKMHSFATLEPCGLGLFRGVEYVCCPKSVEGSVDEEKTDEYANDDDALDEDEDEDDEVDDENESTTDNDEKSTDNDEDPYFEEDSLANEHDRFKDAQERLEKKYRSKVAKVITEWSELFERYSRMKEKDPKGAETYKTEMTTRFRKTVASLEEENREQRRQLEGVHDDRVQAALNERKRKATHNYRTELAIQVGHVNKNNVLKTLKEYIRAEEKDRSHMLNRYRHLLRSNPEDAESYEPMLLHRLHYIDLRINGTLQMLRDFPELEKQLRPIAVDYWHKYRRDNTPEIDQRFLDDASDEQSNERLIQLYKDAVSKKNKETRVESTFNEIVKTTHKDVVSKTKFVPLKEILSQKPQEDSDEDQFEDDEETESKDEAKEPEKIETRPIVLNETAMIEQFAKNSIDNESKQKAIKEDDPKETNVFDEDEESDEESDEDSAETDKQIGSEMLDSDLEFTRKNIEPSYARQDQLIAEGAEPHEHSNNSWTTQTTMIVYSTLVLCVLAIAAIVLRHRPSRQGFIEVDVCNPEDYHVNKMQVNGYENPTYSFYDSKP